jgi:IS5 family transposase
LSTAPSRRKPSPTRSIAAAGDRPGQGRASRQVCRHRLKQTFAKEGRELRRKAGGYAHAKQFKRLCAYRQAATHDPGHRPARNRTQAGHGNQRIPEHAITHLKTLLERAGRIHTQQPKDKNKLYALHAPEVECIGKGKARKPYEFGVKASIAVTHKSGLMVGARTFPGNPYDGHISRRNWSRPHILLEDVGRSAEAGGG